MVLIVIVTVLGLKTLGRMCSRHTLFDVSSGLFRMPAWAYCKVDVAVCLYRGSRQLHAHADQVSNAADMSIGWVLVLVACSCSESW